MRLKSIVKCTTCKRDLPREAFDFQPTTRGDKNAIKKSCRECRNAKPALRYAATQEEIAERFWAYVDSSGGPDACWPWTGSCNHGYGTFHLPGKGSQRAHRIAFQLTHGRPPAGVVRHLVCDNPPCCNPAHLAEGTHLDNMRDRINHDRQAKGEDMATSKLTAEIVREARLRYEPRSETNSAAALAREFGVSINTMTRALSGETWKHVDARSEGYRPTFYVLTKLSDEDVAEVRSLYRKGERVCSLARRYSVSHSLISNIVRGKRRAA